MPDPAYGDSYLGNGYYPTWCADVVRRQLARAALDPRYASGETILTFWPWPNSNFGGGNDCVRALHTDEGRTVTVAMPILHFLGLLSRMGPDYHVLPEQTVGGHVVSGFASADGKAVRVLLYSHNMADTQSRSGATFEVSLRLTGLKATRVRVDEYRFDAEHNSYYRLAREQRDRPAEGPRQRYPAAVVKEVERLSALRRTGTSTHAIEGGKLTIKGPVAGNGASVLVLEPER
jgi:hypothetical protein